VQMLGNYFFSFSLYFWDVVTTIYTHRILTKRTTLSLRNTYYSVKQHSLTKFYSYSFLSWGHLVACAIILSLPECNEKMSLKIDFEQLFFKDI
jgi:hypothetical protein